MSQSVTKKTQSKTTPKDRIRWITKVSILSAIAFIAMMFEIPLPFAPAFYKLGLDECVVLLAGFSLGPMAAAAVEAMKIVLHMLFSGTHTAGVGELMNFLIGLSYVLPASIYYQHHKTKAGAWTAMAIGTLCLTLGGTLANYFIALPMYSYFFGMPMDAILNMGTALNPAITNKLTFCLFAVAPFNLVKGIVCSLVTGILYKRVSPILKK
ncbi:MAG: ECF transporter S component [Erysipelotrichaceae bacterium]|nr:ECF transporter S component [Erysipelotrichaceae bacterium]